MSQIPDPTAPPPAPAAGPAAPAAIAPAAPAPVAHEPGEGPREMRARIAEQNRRIAELEASNTTWQTKATEVQTKYEQDLVMVNEGGNFRHPAVQRVIRREYADYAADAGPKALPFGQWFAAADTRANPVIGVHFAQPAPAAPATGAPPPVAVVPPAPPPANPNAHTAPTPTPGRKYTADDIAGIRKANGGRLPKDVLAALNADGLPVQ
jgi:pyruvate dehydrogenase E2 component (dihydrolipoamide acetyltransferase)